MLWVSVVEQELLTHLGHMSSLRFRVVQSLVFCVVFYRSLFVLLFILYGYCAVCHSSLCNF
jgi:hypothetical protein